MTPITVATGLAGTPFGPFVGPWGIAVAPNQKPAAALAQPAAGTVGSTVSFDASGSTDSDGTIATYTFDFGDGTTPVTQVSPSIMHSYSYGSPIGYAASVTVKDNYGVSSVAKAIKNVAITGTPWAQIGYIANSGANTVSVINMANNATMATIPVGAGPRGVAVSPDGSKVYVTNYNDGTMSVIATASNIVSTTITVGTSPWGVAFSRDGAKAYVTNFGSNTVTSINAATNTPATTIILNNNNPQAVAFSPDGVNAYVTNSSSSGTVTPITVTSNTAATAFGTFNSAYGIAMLPDQAPTAGLAAVATGEAMTLIPFDASTSSDPTGTIANYAWDFGDGTNLATTQPLAWHEYRQDGSYTASVTVTDTVGTSTARVFTGQTVSRNGKATAMTTTPVTIVTPFSIISPGPVAFGSWTLNGTNKVLTATMPLKWSVTPSPDSGPTGIMSVDGDRRDGYDTEEFLSRVSGGGCEDGAGIVTADCSGSPGTRPERGNAG